jgi:hypothetical protein
MAEQYPRPRRAPRAPQPREDLSGPTSLAVVGESHYQDALLALAGPPRPGGVELRTTFRLVPEPDNAYDPNAIVVRTTEGATVGYLPRAEAVRYGPLVPAGGASCAGVVLGGDADRDSGFGVWLHVVAP